MFAGIVEPAGSRIGESLLKQASTPEGLAHIPYDAAASWQTTVTDSSVTLVQQCSWNSPKSKLQKGMVEHVPSKTKVIAWARIDNQQELLSKLSKDLHSLCQNDAGFILAAYLSWGDRVCEYLIGDFAFAVYNALDNTVYLGRDHMGVKPLYYYFDGKHFAFATSLAVLNQLPELKLELSKEWLARYLLNVSEDWSATTYNNIFKLPPAHFLKFNLKKIELKRYFEFSYASDLTLGSDEEYVEAYRELLDKAVACRVQSDYPVGSESSGGLDSSTVTALASHFMPRPGQELHAFGYDESELTPECIISVSQTNRLRMTHFASKTRGHPGYDLNQRFNLSHGAPVEHPNGISHHMFYEVAQKLGIRTLLSGFGGDEFVTNTAQVALVEFFRNKDWRMFFSRQRGNLFLRPVNSARWLYQYYRHNNHFLISRQLKEGAIKNWELRFVNDVTARRYNLKNRLLKDKVYDGGETRQNDFILNDRWSPNMTARLENCTLMAASYGIDYRWPLLDIRLLNFYLSVPASQKLGPKMMGRYLHRRAVADVLPEFIVWKQKDMEPFKFWERIKLWSSRTPLGKVLMQLTQPAPTLRPPAGAAEGEETEPPLSMHAILDSMIAEDRLQRALKILRNQNLNKKHRIMLQRKISQVQQLNQWLHAHDLLKKKKK